MASPIKIPNLNQDLGSHGAIPTFGKPFAFSKESMSNTLNLHDTWPTQVAIRRTWSTEISPINSIQNSSYAQFRVDSHGNIVIDPFNCYTKSEVKVERKDNKALGDKDYAFLVNNISSAAFKSCRINLNAYNIQEADGVYHYRSNLEKTLMATSEGQNGSYCLAGYIPEKTKLDSLDNNEIEQIKAKPAKKSKEDEEEEKEKLTKDQKNFKTRCEELRNNKILQFIDIIHADICRQDKKLPPGSVLDFWFDRQDNMDLLIKNITGKESEYKLIFNRIVLVIRFCEVDESVISNMMTVLETIPYQIPLRRVEINYFCKASGISDYSEPNALVKEGNFLPRRIFFVAIEQDAFHGHPKKDPFYYKNLNPASICLKVGGQVLPYPEIQMNREEILNDFTEPFFYLQQAVGTCFSPDARLPFKPKDMDTGNFIVGYDLTSVDADNAFELAQKTTVELQYKLRSAPNKPHILLVYMEYDSEIQINNQGQVQIIRS